jgi:hypothetical protein
MLNNLIEKLVIGRDVVGLGLWVVGCGLKVNGFPIRKLIESTHIKRAKHCLTLFYFLRK